MRIHYLQHVHFEGPANIVKWAKKKGHKLTGTHLYNYESLPEMNQFDWLIIMGGPMNIYEEEKYPWLKIEKEFIKKAVESNKVVIGICLGAQLITDVLGGKVTKNLEGEIGWLPVNFNENAFKFPFFKNFQKTNTVFQWHNDTFSILAPDSVLIAGSEACSNQAFIYKDKVVGFQFHMESSEESIYSLIVNCADEMTEGKYMQSEKEIRLGMETLKTANYLMEEFLNSMEGKYKGE